MENVRIWRGNVADSDRLFRFIAVVCVSLRHRFHVVSIFLAGRSISSRFLKDYQQEAFFFEDLKFYKFRDFVRP